MDGNCRSANRLRIVWLPLLVAALLLLGACMPQSAPIPPATVQSGPAASTPVLPTVPLSPLEQTGPAPTTLRTPEPGATTTARVVAQAATPVPLPVTPAAPSPVSPSPARVSSPAPSSVAALAATVGPSVAPSPTAVQGVEPSPLTQPVEILAPLLIDGKNGRLYAPAQAGRPARAQTVVLSAVDGRPLALYDVSGPLGLDAQAGRFYVDLGDRGLAVLDAATGAWLRTVELPAANGWSDGSPAPQADPAAGQVFAMRNNSVYVVDPASGQILRNIDFDLRPQDGCRSPHDALLPIAGSRYDPVAHILYLDFVTYSCIPYVGYAIVAYDVSSGKEISRGGAWPFQATADAGRQFVSSWYRMGTGNLSLWSDGRMVSESTDWSGGAAAPYLDTSLGVVYQNPAGGLLRVFDAATLRLQTVLPQPVPGRLVGFDAGTKQLYFLDAGRLQAVSNAQITAPPPQPIAAAAPPAKPVTALAVSPGYSSDRTILGVFGADQPSEGCYVFGQSGGQLLSSTDGGQSWSKPQSGLPGACAYATALAISPDFPRDQTAFLGIAGSGVFKTSNGGALWAPASAGLPSVGIRRVLLSPGYARDHTAFVVGWSGPIQRSVDGGQTWVGVGKEGDALAALSPEFDQDRTLAAWGYGNPNQLRVSRDGGEHWEPLLSPAQSQVALVGLSLAPAFARWQVMFAVDSQGALYRSGDGGKSWKNVLSTGVDNSLGAQIAYGPGETDRPVFVLVTAQDTGVVPPGLNGRLFRSRDGGQTWQPLDPGSGIIPTALAVSPNFAQDAALFLGASDGRVVTVQIAP